ALRKRAASARPLPRRWRSRAGAEPPAGSRTRSACGERRLAAPPPRPAPEGARAEATGLATSHRLAHRCAALRATVRFGQIRHESPAHLPDGALERCHHGVGPRSGRPERALFAVPLERDPGACAPVYQPEVDFDDGPRRPLAEPLLEHPQVAT